MTSITCERRRPPPATPGRASDNPSSTSVALVAESSSATSEEVSASTEQTSASTQQIAASAQELSRTAEQLQSLVGRFVVSA